MVDSNPDITLLLEKMNGSLRLLNESLVYGMQQNSQIMGHQFEETKKLKEAMDKNKEVNQRQTAMIHRSGFGPNFAKGLSTLGLSVMTMGNALKNTLTQANSLQKQALSRGLDLSRLTQQSVNVTDELNKRIVGYSDSLGLSMDMVAAGLNGNNVQVAKAAAMSKLTTGQNKLFLKELARNTEGLGFSEVAVGKLAKSSMALSQRFGVTVEELQGTIGKLVNEMRNMGALGLGPQFAEASQRLAAALGPELKQLGPDLLAHFTKGSSMIQSSILGIGDERRRLLQGEGNYTRASFDMLLKASNKAMELTEQWTRNSKDQAFALDMLKGVYGEQITQLVQWRKAMEDAGRAMNMSAEQYAHYVEQQREVSDGFRKTWEGLKSRLLSPFQKLFTWFAKALIKILDIPGMETIATIVLGAVSAIIGLASVMTVLKTGIAANAKAVTQNTVAMVASGKRHTASLLSQLMYYMPFGMRGKQKLPGSYRNPKTGRFTQAPTGFWDKLKSVFGFGSAVKSQPGVVAKGGLAVQKAGGFGGAIKGVLGGIGRLLSKFFWPLTILTAIFQEFKALKKLFVDFGQKVWAMTANLREMWSGAEGQMKEGFAVLDNIGKLFSPIGKILVFVVDILLDIVLGVTWVAIKIVEAITWLAKWTLKGINAIFTYVINPVVEALNTAIGWLRDIWGALTDWDLWPDWFGGEDGPKSTYIAGSMAKDIDKYAVALEPFRDQSGKVGQAQLDQLMGLSTDQKSMVELLQEQNELLVEIVQAGYNPGGVNQPTTPVSARRGGVGGPRGL